MLFNKPQEQKGLSADINVHNNVVAFRPLHIGCVFFWKIICMKKKFLKLLIGQKYCECHAAKKQPIYFCIEADFSKLPH